MYICTMYVCTEDGVVFDAQGIPDAVRRSPTVYTPGRVWNTPRVEANLN